MTALNVHEPTRVHRSRLGRVMAILRLATVTLPLLVAWLAAAAVHDTFARVGRAFGSGRDLRQAEPSAGRPLAGATSAELEAAEVGPGARIPVGKHHQSAIDRG
jgi:hypothetical protein